MNLLETPLSSLGAWGTRYQKILKKRNIQTCRDLMLYFPYRIDDFSIIAPITEVRPGTYVTVCGTIQLIANRRSPRTRKVITEALVSDETGSIKVLWFNQPFLTKNLKVGDRVSLAGKANDQFLDLQLISPAYEKMGTAHEALHTGRCVPVYSLPESASQKVFRTLIKQALDRCLSNIQEWIPQDVLESEQLLDVRQAFFAIHFPKSLMQWEKARDRLKFDELLLLQLARCMIRKELKCTPAKPVVISGSAQDAFIRSLPFTLTHSQQAALKEIVHDLAKETPMNRLLEGDVGSGKTVLAGIALLHTVESGMQAAYMAPTEILAQQHFQTLCNLFKNNDATIALLTSSSQMSWSRESGEKNYGTKKDREAFHDDMRQGRISLVVGTHALLEEKILFGNLGLIVIDEQHRFGVLQRKLLREKNASGYMPHLLSMTATPIPRSLALTLYGDLDISLIDEMPIGRKKIITKLVPANYREWTYNFIKKLVSKGRQTFIICPIIDPSDTLGVRSVNQEYKRLKETIFQGLSIGMLHGRMKSVQKEEIMRKFAEGSISILVSTTVVEVGVDVPNATIMMIEGAESFGLAQLHQLRGRIGRSNHQAYCFLLPTTEDMSEKARLKAVVSCTNGFELAEKDLELRGSGEVFGQRQSGLPDLKLASLNDRALIQKTRKYAEEFIEKLEQYPRIVEQLNEYQKGELRD